MIIVYGVFKTIRRIRRTTRSAPSFESAATVLTMDGTRVGGISFPLGLEQESVAVSTVVSYEAMHPTVFPARSPLSDVLHCGRRQFPFFHFLHRFFGRSDRERGDSSLSCCEFCA